MTEVELLRDILSCLRLIGAILGFYVGWRIVTS